MKKKKKMGEVTKKDKSLHPIPIVFCAYFCYITKAPPPKKKWDWRFAAFTSFSCLAVDSVTDQLRTIFTFCGGTQNLLCCAIAILLLLSFIFLKKRN